MVLHTGNSAEFRDRALSVAGLIGMVLWKKRDSEGVNTVPETRGGSN